MRAFIAGGTGVIGNNLARKLISKGNQVGLLIKMNSNLKRLKISNKKLHSF